MAIGIWAATAGLGVALGPVVGGFLLDHFWWGSIFIVNVPLTAIAIVAGRRLLPESRDPVARRIDWTGAALSGVGLVAFVWAVIEAPSKGWTSAAGARRRRARRGRAGRVRGLAAPRRGAAARRPPVPRTRASPRPAATIMVLFFALFGFLFLSTQYLQFVLGYSPSAAGVRVLPYAGAMIVFAPLSSKLVARLGTKRVVTAGMLLFAAGLAVAATVTHEHAATAGSPSRCSSWARAWGSRALRRPSRSWARSRPSGRTSGPPSTTRRASSAARSASPSSAASCRRSTRRSSPRRRVPAPPAARVARRRRPGRRRRRGRGARGVRPRDVARVDRRRARRRARRLHRLALSPGPRGQRLQPRPLGPR